jgi:hypothetical protein
MLWSLLVSGYIIYLYRKLNAEGQTQPSLDGGRGMSALDAELAKLNERIGNLESRLPAAKPQERSS